MKVRVLWNRSMYGISMALLLGCLIPGPLAAEDLIPHTHSLKGFGFVPPDRHASSFQDLPTGFTPNEKLIETKKSGFQLTPMSGREKWHYYLNSAYGPFAIGASVLAAGIKQTEPSVPEWGGGMEGYGKRLASHFGQRTIDRSIRIGLNALLHEDPRYFRSNRSGVWNRTFYAAGQTFVVHKDSGGTRIAVGRFAGNFGSACISRQWHPESYRNAGDCLTSGLISLGIDAGRNVMSEFWPDMKRWFRR